MINNMSLTELPLRKTATVVSIAGGRGVEHKLENFGLKPGKQVEKITNSLIKGPVVLKIGNSRISVGFRIAEKIFVRLGA